MLVADFAGRTELAGPEVEHAAALDHPAPGMELVAVRIRHVQIDVGVAVPRYRDLHVAGPDGDVLYHVARRRADRPAGIHRRHVEADKRDPPWQFEPHPPDEPMGRCAVRQVDLVVAEIDEVNAADRKEQLVGARPGLDVQEERSAGHVDVVARHLHGGSAARLRHVLEPRHAGGVAHFDRRDDGPDEGELCDGDRELELAVSRSSSRAV